MSVSSNGGTDDPMEDTPGSRHTPTHSTSKDLATMLAPEHGSKLTVEDDGRYRQLLCGRDVRVKLCMAEWRAVGGERRDQGRASSAVCRPARSQRRHRRVARHRRPKTGNIESALATAHEASGRATKGIFSAMSLQNAKKASISGMTYSSRACSAAASRPTSHRHRRRHDDRNEIHALLV